MQNSKSFSHQMREASQKINKPDASKVIAEVLGFVSREAKKTIIEDLSHMIKNNLQEQLNGYLLAISRITANDLAKECITDAYLNNKVEIPEKYKIKFGF